MKNAIGLSLIVAGVLFVWAPVGPVVVRAQQAPTVAIPQPGVPQVMTMEASFVRAAYNNEGYVILGYRAANGSVGEEWLMLDTGMTVRSKTPTYKLKRDAISLSTPDGGTLPLPSVEEYRTANLTALNNRANVARDSINYFPPMATQACRIGFFSELSGPALPWDEVELSNTRACLGRLSSGDGDAAASLYDRHARAIYSLVLRIVDDEGDAEGLRVWAESREAKDRNEDK